MRVKAGEVKKASRKYSTLEQQIVEVRRIWLSCRMPQSLRKQPVNVSASLGIPCKHLMAWTCCTCDPFSVNHTFCLPAWVQGYYQWVREVRARQAANMA